MMRHGMLQINSIVWAMVMIFLLSSMAWSQETVKVGCIFALSGSAQKSNAQSLNGVRLGIQEVNERGGVLGRELELIAIDNQSTPIGSKVAADRAVNEQVVAIIGPAWSSHSLAAAPVAQENSIPMITNIATNEKITRIGDCIFRVCFTDSFQGNVMAQFAWDDLKAETAVVFVDITSDYSMGLSEVFRNNFERLGGRILLELHYKYKQDDFSALVSQSKNAEKSSCLYL